MSNKTRTNYKPDGRDLFQTPRYAIELLIPFLKTKYIWECAGGDGCITNVLEQNKFKVIHTDIRERPPMNVDFLDPSSDWVVEGLNRNYTIVTNPPFSRKRQFYERCLELNVPFALLIPADYSMWMIDAVRNQYCVKIVPTRRIDYITPTGKDAFLGATADFHSLWLTGGLVNYVYPITEVFVDLSLEDKKRIY